MIRRTDWRSLLEKHGFHLMYGDKAENSIHCPFHDDTQASLSVNVDKGVWFCHAGCGQGSLKGFFREVLGKASMALESQVYEDDFTVDFSPEEEDGPLEEVRMPWGDTDFPEWVLDRGFTQETLESWDCKVSDSGSLVIPVKDVDERLVGWVCRKAQGHPKYVYSTGLKTSKILFGLYNVPIGTSHICITEGPLDTFWLSQQGFRSVAMFGVNFSKTQEQFLISRRPKEIVLCLDNDEPGQLAADSLQERLMKYAIVSRVSFPDPYKDAEDVKDREELVEIFKKRSLI